MKGSPWRRNQRIRMEPSRTSADGSQKTTGRTERGAGAEKQNSDDGAFLYGASMFLVLTILVIGATMVNNYNRMKDMEVTLQEMALGSDGQSSGLSKGTEKQKETDALAASAQAEGEIAKESAAKDETEKTWILKKRAVQRAIRRQQAIPQTIWEQQAAQEQREAAQQPMEQEVPELPVGRIAPHPAVPLQITVRHPLRM